MNTEHFISDKFRISKWQGFSQVHVLLDLDGTLTDPGVGITRCIRHALMANGYQPLPDNELEKFIGPPLCRAFMNLVPEAANSTIDRLIATYRSRYNDVGMFENVVYDGIPSSLGALRDHGATLLVATSKAQVFAERIIQHFDLSKYVEAVHGSELDGARSDKRELISYVLRVHAVRVSNAVMVGDRKHDVIGAIGNNLEGVGVLWGYGDRHELTAAGARTLLMSPDELAYLPFNDDIKLTRLTRRS